jgi:hypothetical protein
VNWNPRGSPNHVTAVGSKTAASRRAVLTIDGPQAAASTIAAPIQGDSMTAATKIADPIPEGLRIVASKTDDRKATRTADAPKVGNAASRRIGRTRVGSNVPSVAVDVPKSRCGRSAWKSGALIK